MNRRRRVYEGKAKVLYEGPEPGTLIQHFKDDATAFNNKKHALIEGKGGDPVLKQVSKDLTDKGVAVSAAELNEVMQALTAKVEAQLAEKGS